MEKTSKNNKRNNTSHINFYFLFFEEIEFYRYIRRYQEISTKILTKNINLKSWRKL